MNQDSFNLGQEKDSTSSLTGTDEVTALLINAGIDFEIFFTQLCGFEMAPFHKEWYRLLNYNKYVSIIAPRGHGKTTLISCFLLWKIFYKSHLEILITSDVHKQATDILEHIKGIIENNDHLRSLIPENKDITWSKTEIMTVNRCRIVTRANTRKIRGGHYNYVMCDEVGEYKDKGNFYGVVMPTVNAKNGSIFAIGTPKTKIDLLAELSEKDSGYISRTYRALHVNGDPLWPSMYPKEKLAAIKASMPSIQWQREYMCNPIGDETSLFPYEVLSKAFNPKAQFINYAQPNARYYLGIDVAMSPRSEADFSVWTVIQLDEDYTRHIVRIERSKGENFEQQFERTYKLYTQFKITKAVIDEGSFGKAFFDRFKASGMVIEAYSFQGDRRQELLTRLLNFFENGKIKIPRNKQDMETIEQTDILIQELMDMQIGYTERHKKEKWDTAGAHDDTVMSLGLAVNATAKIGGKVGLCWI